MPRREYFPDDKKVARAERLAVVGSKVCRVVKRETSSKADVRLSHVLLFAVEGE